MATDNSPRLFEKSDFKKIAIILGIALVIGIYLIATTVVISKDGVFYVQQAQKCFNQPEALKGLPFGFPYLIFFAHRISSFFCQSDSLQNWIYCAQSVSLISRLAALAVIYFAAKFLVGSQKSFLAVLVLVFLPYPAEMGSDVLREWPHLLFLYAGLLFFILAVNLENKWFYGIAGLISGLGFIIRPECAQVIVYALVWLLVRLIKPPSEKMRFKTTLAIVILIVGFCIPAAPYMKASGRILPRKIKNLISIKQVEQHEDFLQKKDVQHVYMCSFGDIVKGTDKLFARVNENLMYFFTLPALLGAYVYFKKQKNLFKVFMPASFIVFYLIIMHLLYYDYEYISRRHCLPLVVMLVFFIPDGLEVLSKWLSGNVFKKTSLAGDGSGKLFVALLVLGIIIGVPKLLRPLGSDKEGYIAAAEWLKENSPKDAFVFCTDSRVGFYAERKNLSDLNKKKLPSELYIVEISKNGEGALSKEYGNVSEEYSGRVNPRDERKRITIYKRI